MLGGITSTELIFNLVYYYLFKIYFNKKGPAKIVASPFYYLIHLRKCNYLCIRYIVQYGGYLFPR